MNELTNITPGQLAALEPEARKAILDQVHDYIEALEAMRDQVFRAMLDGQVTVPGYTICDGRAKRSWALAELETIFALKERAQKCGVNPMELFAPVTPAKAMKILGKAADDLIIEDKGKPFVMRQRKDAK